MKDYEQLYYDSLYEINKLKFENRLLKEELDMYKLMQKNKNLKKVIIDMLLNYKRKCDTNEKD